MSALKTQAIPTQSISIDHADGIVNALIFLIRAYNTAIPRASAEDFGLVLRSSTILSPMSIRSIVEAIVEAERKTLNINVAPIRQVNILYYSNSFIWKLSFSFLKAFDLVDMNWRIGIAKKSNESNSISMPFVSLQLNVRDNDGTDSIRSMELSCDEFQVKLIYI